MRQVRVLAVGVFLCACGPGSRSNDNGGGSQVDAPAHHADSAGATADAAPDPVYVYAHTSSTLFRVNPDTLAIGEVGDFVWPGTVIFDQMTDIAIDKNDRMIGVSFSRVYQVDPATAQTTLLSSSLQGEFNGLSFIPADQLGETGDDVLVGTRNTDGAVFRIDPMTGVATQIGNMGAYQSSGDVAAVAGFGTVQTITGPTNDVLARLAPSSFAAAPIGIDTGYSQIWGIAFWKDKIYGFTNGGQFILIDPMTGAATLVSTSAQQWWGAAVTTLAPIIE